MTSSNSASTPLQTIDSSTQSIATNTTSQEAVAGRGFPNGEKKNNSSAHSKTESLSNGRSRLSPAVPSLAGSIHASGNNAVNSTGSLHHTRKASVTISASGAVGQLPNGGPMAGKAAVGNGMPVFGSMNASSPGIAPTSLQPTGSLNPLSPNPSMNSPQQSPSPIPQPSASGGRPPSSLQSGNAAVSFGNFGPEEPSRHQRPSISGMSSGSLTPSMGSAALRRESSQQSNSEMNGNLNMNGNRGGYHGNRGRGGYSGNHAVHPQTPYSPNPGFRQVQTPRTAGSISQFPQGNRSSSYQGQGMPARPSPHMGYASPATPGPMGMASPAMQGQAQYYQQAVNQHISLNIPAQKQQNSARPLSSLAAQNHVSSARFFMTPTVALPTNLAPESGQFEQFLMQTQGYFQGPDGNMYAAPPYNYGMPPQMQQSMHMGQQAYYPQSPRPPHAMTPQQGQFNQNQYGQQPQSMSRTNSQIGERPGSTAGQPPSTPMTPAAGHAAQPPTNRPSPAPKNDFIVPKKTGGIKIVNPNTKEELKIERAPESPAIIPVGKSPANVPTNAAPPTRTPESHTRTDSASVKNPSDIAKKFRDEVASKLNAEKAEAEKLKQQSDTEDKAVAEKESTNVGAVESPEAVKAEATKVVEPVKAEQNPAAAQAAETTPSIVEPAKTDSPAEPEKELTEEDDEYWERIEAEELAKEEERERKYQEKKKLLDAEKAKKQAEEDAKLDEELKRAEREAEAREEARQKKLEDGGADTDREAFASLKKSDNAFKATESTAAESSGVDTPTSDVSSSMAPPAARTVTAKSKPAALKLETSKQVEAPTPSAALMSLRSARFLTKIDDKTYPTAINSPNPALNSTAPLGRFRYDKNFLMQFQSVFTEKPSETWSDKIRDTVGDADTPQTAKGSRSHTMGTIRGPGSQPKSSILNKFPSGVANAMGSFDARGSTSEERFQASMKMGGRQPSNSKPYGMPAAGGFGGGAFGGAGMMRSSSTTSMGHPQSPRNPSSRGGRGGSRAGGPPHHNAKTNAAMPLTAGMAIDTNLKVSETGWKPMSLTQGSSGPPPGGDNGYLAPDIVQRKVKSNLNKMTPTTFDKISAQIIEIVMQSKQETDGRTLRQVIQLTFEKATDEAHWAQMYANFCSRMLISMTPEIRDETLGLDKNGNVTAGNTLFRRYLLNRCQQDFEAGWKSKLPDLPEGQGGEATMLSDEYYAAAAAKRRGLGLIKFIGELYKLGMLTSRIMVMCVQRLLEYEGTPEEAEIESLSSLLNTIGEALDNDEKARGAMNAFFQRIGEILKIESLPSRLRFMLLDLVDLRKANWKGKHAASKGPATIDQIHQQAAAAEREKEAQRIMDQQKARSGPGGGRMQMGRGDARFGGQMAPPPVSNSVDMSDLRRLGRSSSRQTNTSGGPVSFGPTSMFNTRGSNTSAKKGFGVLGRAGDESGASSRTGTPPAQKKDDKDAKGSTNAFSALAALDPNEGNEGPGSPPSTATSPALTNARPSTTRTRSKSPLKDDESSTK